MKAGFVASAIALAVFTQCPESSAARPQAPQGARQHARPIKLQFEHAFLPDVVKWFSQNTGANFIVSDGEHDRFTIFTGRPVPVEQAWEALRVALSDRQLALLDDGNFYRIVRQQSRSTAGFRVRPHGERTWTIQTNCRSGANCPALSEEARHPRIVQALKNGEPIGMKLFAISPGSTIDQLGLKNGDVVLRINGKPFTAPDQLLDMASGLKDGNRIVVDLQRQGKEISHTYLVQRGADRAPD